MYFKIYISKIIIFSTQKYFFLYMNRNQTSNLKCSYLGILSIRRPLLVADTRRIDVALTMPGY